MKSSEIITSLYQNPKKRAQIFQDIPEKKRASIFLQLRKHLQHQIIKGLPKDQIISLLESLDTDDATDALQLFDKHAQKQLLSELSEKVQNEIGSLLKFDEKTAGGLMSLNYIQVDVNETISDVAEKFKLHEKRTGKAPEIIALKEGKVAGYVPGYELGFARSSEKIRRHVKSIKKIHHGTADSEVAEMFRQFPHNKLVVLDDVESPIGIIYSDDVLRVLKEQESASLYDFAGVQDEEEVTDPARLKIRFRYKWLIINLATAFLAAFTVGLFKSTLDKHVLLAVYMPIVAGMGGNAATQTLAVMVRGIALKQISINNFIRPLFSELLTGLVNGIINGALVFSIVLLLNKDFMIALILSAAMIVNLLVAAFFGTIIPIVMKSLKKDPASSATIFITTATDVLGFLTFLGLATLFLH